VPGREALSSSRRRDVVAPIAALCLALRDGQEVLAGAIRVWPVQIGAASALLIGTVAVPPTRQGEGLGRLLMETGLDRAGQRGWARAMLVGDAPYYGRFGFERLTGVDMPPPTNPERVLGLALTAGAWAEIRGKVGKAGNRRG